MIVKKPTIRDILREFPAYLIHYIDIDRVVLGDPFEKYHCKDKSSLYIGAYLRIQVSDNGPEKYIDYYYDEIDAISCINDCFKATFYRISEDKERFVICLEN
jgi:hypothetical protein